jgi:hypothetical protein
LQGLDDLGLGVELERLDAKVEVLLGGHLLRRHGPTHAENAGLLLALAGHSPAVGRSVLLACAIPNIKRLRKN